MVETMSRVHFARSRTPVVLVVGALLSLSCTTTQPGPPSPPDEFSTGSDVASLGFAPSDLSSDIGATALRVTVFHGDKARQDAVAKELAPVVRLTSLPGRVPVPATVSVVPTPTGAGLPEYFAYVDVKPQGALAAGWYALEVAAIKSKTRTTTAAVGPNGAWVARFAVGSAPVLKQVRLADKVTSTRVYVDFSEGVDDKAGIAGRVVVAEDGGSPCSYVPPPQGSSSVRTSMPFDCAVTLSKTQRVRLTLEPGLLSTGSKEVGVFDPNATAAPNLVRAGSQFQRVLDFGPVVGSANTKAITVTQ